MNDNPLSDLLPRFREMAEEARHDSLTIRSPEVRRGLQTIVETWERLIKGLEAN